MTAKSKSGNTDAVPVTLVVGIAGWVVWTQTDAPTYLADFHEHIRPALDWWQSINPLG